MKKTYFIIGDVHGEDKMLDEMLKNWDESTQQLVFLGDLIDRGPNNKKSVLTAMKYVKEKNAWYVMGNHEVMFLAWIDNPEERNKIKTNEYQERLANGIVDGIVEYYK